LSHAAAKDDQAMSQSSSNQGGLVGFNPEKSVGNTGGEQPPKKDDTAVKKALGKIAVGGAKK
jgi:hypothetical protein